VKIITIIIQTEEFHVPAKNQVKKGQKITGQTAKANGILSVKYWQTARIVSLAQLDISTKVDFLSVTILERFCWYKKLFLFH